jgi:hypothetical protein
MCKTDQNHIPDDSRRAQSRVRDALKRLARLIARAVAGEGRTSAKSAATANEEQSDAAARDADKSRKAVR